ncbi:MAG: acyl-CoA dehydrogenase [Chloroflexi bacterium]|nr:MAG: acyl-CoA dehydrogenase [Chloroflexota bacterium]
MNFAETSEQELLRGTAREMLSNGNSLGLAHVRALNDGAAHLGVSAGLDDVALWSQMAELGWLGLPFPPEYGGAGGSFMDLAVLLEELGRAVAPPAYTGTVVVCGMTVLHHAREELRRRWLPSIAEGSSRLTLVADGGSAVRAHPDGGALRLDGGVKLVDEAQRSDAYLVAAVDTPEDQQPATTLFMLERETPGIRVSPQRTVAGGDRGDVELDGVRVSAEEMVGERFEGASILGETLERGAVASCLDMVGAGGAVLEMVTAYVAERVQFGRPVGSFQAVQHHAADMAVDMDASRLITYEAAWRLGEGLDASMEVAMAKAWTSQAYRRVTTLGHQLFGGIGLMREHDMHLYMRRGRRDALAFGDATGHLDRLAGILEERGTPWPE